MTTYTGVLPLATPDDMGTYLYPEPRSFVLVGISDAGPSTPQPIVGGRLLYIDGNKIKALPEASP